MGILDVPLNSRKYTGRVENWARNFPGSFNRFPILSTPPIVTFGGNSSSVNSNYTNGQVTYAPSSLQMQGSVFQDSFLFAGPPPQYAYKKPAHITDSTGNKSGGNAPIRARFLTDSPTIDLCFIDRLYSQFNLIIDRQYIARDRVAVFGNTGNFRYIKCDFGSDVVTWGKVASNFSITSGGSGYAVGDLITLNGGSNNAAGTPTTVRVGSVMSGAVGSVDVVNKGSYATAPSGTFSQSSTTGAGSGFQMSASFFHPQHSTRKIRLIELVYSNPADFYGLVIPQGYSIQPAPDLRSMPKLAIIGDSITIGTYLGYGASHYGASLAQKLGLWEKCIISGIGGSGWNTGGPSNTPWSHANRIADYISYDADIYMFVGSQNDTNNSATRDAVTSTINQIIAAKPNAYIVGIGPIMGANVALSATIGAGFSAASQQSRIRYIDNNAGIPWISNTEQSQWSVDSDQNHLSQEGMDRFADIAAPQVAAAIMDMVGV